MTTLIHIHTYVNVYVCAFVVSTMALWSLAAADIRWPYILIYTFFIIFFFKIVAFGFFSLAAYSGVREQPSRSLKVCVIGVVGTDHTIFGTDTKF